MTYHLPEPRRETGYLEQLMVHEPPFARQGIIISRQIPYEQNGEIIVVGNRRMEYARHFPDEPPMPIFGAYGSGDPTLATDPPISDRSALDSAVRVLEGRRKVDNRFR
jgi:hypothetical protein